MVSQVISLDKLNIQKHMRQNVTKCRVKHANDHVGSPAFFFLFFSRAKHVTVRKGPAW